jgi:GT2 family glycosyltransferase
MDLSVIVVNWNTIDLLAQCLQSVYDTVSNPALEVIVVDNASTDGSPAMVRSHFPQARLIENQKNKGFAQANNQAICASHGRYVLLLNSDTIALPGALEVMVHFADRYTEAGIVGCRLLNADGSLQHSWAQFPTFWSELLGRNIRKWRPLADELAYEVDWVGGACLLARRDAIEEVGLLDEGFFMYSEETDWCYRMVQQGWKVCYLAEAEVVHLGGGSSKRRGDARAVALYRSKLRFFRKHHGAFEALLLRAALAAGFLFKGALAAGLYFLSGKRWAKGEQMMARQWRLLQEIGLGLPTFQYVSETMEGVR